MINCASQSSSKTKGGIGDALPLSLRFSEFLFLIPIFSLFGSSNVFTRFCFRLVAVGLVPAGSVPCSDLARHNLHHLNLFFSFSDKLEITLTYGFF